MTSIPEMIAGRVGDVAWTIRPEWLAGRYWWRILVGGHPKVLVRYVEHALPAAEALAADEYQFRREAGMVQG